MFGLQSFNLKHENNLSHQQQRGGVAPQSEETPSMELDKLLFQTAPFNAPQPDTTAKSSNPSQVQNQHHPSQNSNARYCNMQSLPNGNPSHIQQQPPIVSMANSHYDHSHTQNLQQLASGTRDYLLQLNL